MIIETERTQRMDHALDTIERERVARERLQMEDARLRGTLKRMSREEKTVERSGRVGRIGQFNEKFVKSVSRLSIIRQTTPRVTSRDREAAREAFKDL